MASAGEEDRNTHGHLPVTNDDHAYIADLILRHRVGWTCPMCGAKAFGAADLHRCHSPPIPDLHAL